MPDFSFSPFFTFRISAHPITLAGFAFKRKIPMRKPLLILIGLLVSCRPADQIDWKTDYEKSGCLETPRYEQTLDYLHRLEEASPSLKVTFFGTSPQGRKNPLVIVDQDQAFSAPNARRSGKVVVMIQAGIHAGEIDGKDAMLMLLRDMLIDGKYPDILDHVTILFLPFFNVDGHERFSAYNRINQNGPKEMGWRVTSQNLNLNRDYLKADAPEMRDWLAVFRTWLPDLFIDCHVTDGADYRHAVTYAIDLSANVAEPVREWSRRVYMTYVREKMTESGFPMSPYVYLVDEKDIQKGISATPAPPRFSTEYAGAQNRPGFLIETHMFKDYKTRVDGTYQVLLHSLTVAARENESLLQANAEADRQTESMKGQFALSFRPTGRADTIDFLGYNYRLEKSDISGDTWVVWEPVPIDYRLPVYEEATGAETVDIPLAYIVPAQWTDVLDVLRAHGVRMQRLGQDRHLEVESYRFQNPRWASGPFEGRIRVTTDVTKVAEQRAFLAGDWLVRLDQRTNRVILHLLEPKGPDSFVSWGFFHSVFEQKEYGEAYKLEILAREMLADSSIRREFENRMKTDAAFAANPFERLNFFYQRSPYWDASVNLYPVARIVDEKNLP